MPSYPDQHEPVTKRPLSAWGLSLFLHLSVIAVLAAAVQFWPRGGRGNSGDSISVVFNSTADSSTPNDDQSSGGDGRLQAMPEPPALLATPTIAAMPVVEQRQIDPYAVKAQFATAPPATNNSNNNQSQVRAQLGSGGGSGGGNGYTKTNVFGVEGKGNKFVYLFDRSASMEGPPLSAAKRQLLESLQSLDSIHQFQIIFFNSGTQRFHTSDGDRRVVFATDRNKQLAANFVNGITADRGTDRMIALREALTLAPDVIFFLTDADDPMDKSELAELSRLNRGARTAICVIEFGDKPAPPADNFLMQIARDSGGRYGYVDTTTLAKPGAVRERQ